MPFAGVDYYHSIDVGTEMRSSALDVRVWNSISTMALLGVRSMPDQVAWWAPVFKGQEGPSLSMAVPWRRDEPPTEEDYRVALVDHIDELIKSDPKQARREIEDDRDFAYIRLENREHWAFHIWRGSEWSEAQRVQRS
jgi:hypothetical protein